MRPRSLVTTLVVGAALVATTALSASGAGGANTRYYSATVSDAAGRRLGRVEFAVLRNLKTRVTYDLAGPALTPGFHAMHVHRVGVCDPRSQNLAEGVTAFASAAGHLAKPGQDHGAHVGDLPPILVNPDRTAQGMVVDGYLFAPEILDADGAALIVHLGRDNQANIPDRYTSSLPEGPRPGPDALTRRTGDAGDRPACGVIR